MTSIGLTTGPFDAAAFGEPTLAFSREEYLGRIAKLRAGRSRPRVDPDLFMVQCQREEQFYGLLDRQYAHGRGLEEKVRAQGDRLRGYEETLGIRPMAAGA
mgnify:CR=1 FL=1